jgi:uncharacterized protein (DUF2249 family)
MPSEAGETQHRVVRHVRLFEQLSEAEAGETQHRVVRHVRLFEQLSEAEAGEILRRVAECVRHPVQMLTDGAAGK